MLIFCLWCLLLLTWDGCYSSETFSKDGHKDLIKTWVEHVYILIWFSFLAFSLLLFLTWFEKRTQWNMKNRYLIWKNHAYLYQLRNFMPRFLTTVASTKLGWIQIANLFAAYPNQSCSWQLLPGVQEPSKCQLLCIFSPLLS